MTPEEIKKLLGGYATGSLTPEEQQALFAAALEDQELFDALAREQSLRDLLRDPGARAELLAALDTPANRWAGFWQWLRRPAVAGLATAGVVAIAVVAVWQGRPPLAVKQAARLEIAELKSQDSAFSPSEVPKPAQPRTNAPEPARLPEVQSKAKVAASPLVVLTDKKAVLTMATPVPADSASMERRLEKDAPAAAAAPPPPPPPAPAAAAPMPVMAARKAEADAVVAGQPAGAASDAVKENITLDARALFYLNPPAPGANAFVQPSGGGGAAPTPARLASRAGAAPAMAKSATAPRLGVRVSILRGDREVDLTTVLDPGEAVRLNLIPNADGFLYVAEGTRTLARGPAQRLKPFETPELRFEGSGPKQLFVILSRAALATMPISLGSLARGNLVEKAADSDLATYVVSGTPDTAQQVVVPVTLNYRVQ